MFRYGNLRWRDPLFYPTASEPRSEAASEKARRYSCCLALIMVLFVVFDKYIKHLVLFELHC